MHRSRLLLSISLAAGLAGCSGRAGDSIAVDAEAADADAPAAEVSGPDATSDADASSPEGASALDALADDVLAEAPVETSAADGSPAAEAATDLPDAASDAPLGCYLQGYIYCPVDTWCPLGTCPDGTTPYGCTCNPDGSTTCTLDCPN